MTQRDLTLPDPKQAIWRRTGGEVFLPEVRRRIGMTLAVA